jgi:3-dehydroquinate synthase
LALGGGVVGDLAGFVAATVLRGIALVQLPTTLLAMVDSALGGKTGVNHPLGKNLIGAFHQPRLVLSDTNTLATLPARELRAGWAEVIKHGVIRDAGLFEELEDERPKTKDESKYSQRVVDHNDLHSSFVLRPSSLPELIRRAAKVKVDVVNIDERETGERTLLNYGHTLGQALESLTGYGALLHGEAVAIGMDLAARIALRMELWAPESVERQRRLLHAYGLPTALPSGVDPRRLLELTLQDKKVRAGRVRWVLPTAIGAAEVRDDVPEDLVRAVVAAAGAEQSAR